MKKPVSNKQLCLIFSTRKIQKRKKVAQTRRGGPIFNQRNKFMSEGWYWETQQALRDAKLPPAELGSFSSSLVFKMKVRGEVTTITFNRLNVFCSE